MERDDVDGTMGGSQEIEGIDEVMGGEGVVDGAAGDPDDRARTVCDVDGDDATKPEAPGICQADLDDPASLEADARAERVDRVAVLYAQITAATREFLAAVAECDRHRDWAAEGFGSCAEWLAWRIGLKKNAANERVRVARALEELPETSEAMARGELSFSKVRAMTRVATAASETELLDFARACSAAELERVVRAWKTLSREDEANRERVLHRTRRFSVVPDDDGMYVVRGRLTPEVAALLMRAVDAAGDALYRADAERDETDPAQRRADAVGLMAERALAAGFGGDDVPVSGSRAERYQVMLYVEPETLAETGEPGMSELEDGTRVSAETARRLSCDASVVEVTRESRTEGPRPSILDVGRRTRTVPTALRRGLEARDRGCRFPGCSLRFTDAHHIRHWADGGETKLSNLTLLCNRHHRRVHEDGWRVCSDRTGENLVFFTPAGRPLAAAPPLVPERATWGGPTREDGDGRQTAPPRPPSAGVPSGDAQVEPSVDPSPHASAPRTPDRHLLEQFFRALAERGVDPDWRTNLPGFRHDHDIPWAIEAAAWEALEDAADEASSDAAAPDTIEESADLDPGDRSVDEAA